MKRTKTVTEEICDICKSGMGSLDKCIVCGREFCLYCRIIVGRVYHQNMCEVCGDSEEIKNITAKWLEKWNVDRTKLEAEYKKEGKKGGYHNHG